MLFSDIENQIANDESVLLSLAFFGVLGSWLLHFLFLFFDRRLYLLLRQ